MARGVKRLGEYAKLLPASFYEMVPKSVFAAVAVSPAVNGAADLRDDDKDSLAAYVWREWWNLYQQGIVSQRPPAASKWGLEV